MERTPRSLKIEWEAPSEDMIQSHQILLNSAKSAPIRKPKIPEVTQSKQHYDYDITGLVPGADYNLRLVVKYKSGTDFSWPKSNNQTVRKSFHYY